MEDRLRVGTEKQTDIQADIQSNKLTDIKKNRHWDRKTPRHTDTETEIQVSRQADKFKKINKQGK